MKWNFRQKNTRVCINFFLLLFSAVLIIIQDQVYWRKWRRRYNEKEKTHAISLEIEKIAHYYWLEYRELTIVHYNNHNLTKHTNWVCVWYFCKWYILSTSSLCLFFLLFHSTSIQNKIKIINRKKRGKN